MDQNKLHTNFHISRPPRCLEGGGDINIPPQTMEGKRDPQLNRVKSPLIWKVAFFSLDMYTCALFSAPKKVSHVQVDNKLILD